MSCAKFAKANHINVTCVFTSSSMSSNRFLLDTLLRGDVARSGLDDRLTGMDRLGVEGSSEILVDELAGARKRLAALPDGK